MEIRRVTYLDLIDSPLLSEYSIECSIPEIGEPDPQADIYAAMEAAGIMQAFAAMYEDRIAGFATILTPVLPHYGKKVATVESLFIPMDSRCYGLGWELMKAIEEYAQESGCVGILYSAPANGRLERLLDIRKGYQRTNAVFYRKLP